MEQNPILILKENIKELAEKQPILKNQRRTVYREGKKIMTPWDAGIMHADNRFRLRHMYIAYGMLKGKKFKEIESSAKTPFDEEYVSKLCDKYRPEAVPVSA